MWALQSESALLGGGGGDVVPSQEHKTARGLEDSSITGHGQSEGVCSRYVHQKIYTIFETRDYIWVSGRNPHAVGPSFCVFGGV